MNWRNEPLRSTGHGDDALAVLNNDQGKECCNRLDPKALHAGAIGAEAATSARKLTATELAASAMAAKAVRATSAAAP
jgi:hypothetical protein